MAYLRCRLLDSGVPILTEYKTLNKLERALDFVPGPNKPRVLASQPERYG